MRAGRDVTYPHGIHRLTPWGIVLWKKIGTAGGEPVFSIDGRYHTHAVRDGLRTRTYTTNTTVRRA